MSDLELLIRKHLDSIIVISYRNNGIPSISEIAHLLKSYKKDVISVNLGNYGYALNKTNVDNYEYLILGK